MLRFGLVFVLFIFLTSCSSEKKSVESTTNNNSEKNYYRPKKSIEVTKIKDLLYEVDNINIEALVLITLNQIKLILK